jgi:hypothetical protein
VRGIDVVVYNTRPDIQTDAVVARLDRCLALIERYVPHHFRHLQKDFAYIVVQRFACRGAYFHEQRACLVELTFTVNPDFSDAEVAATILHEAMHARLHALGFPLEMEDRARQERSAGARKSNLECSRPMASAWSRERSGLQTCRTKRSPQSSIRVLRPSASPKSTAQRCGIEPSPT